MSNVIQMFDDTSTHSFGLEESKCNFPVTEKGLYYLDGQSKMNAVHSHKVIVNPTNGHQFAVVGKNYALIKHVEVFASLEDSMRRTFNSRVLETVKPIDEISYFGRDAIRRYRIGAFSGNPDGRSDIVFEIIGKHSYGMGAINIMFGEWRLICANGAIAFDSEHIYRRHTSGLLGIDALDDLFGRKFEIACEAFNKRMRTLQKLSQLLTTHEKVKEFLDKHYSDRRAEAVFDLYVKLCNRESNRQPSLIQLYHAVTFFASHTTGPFSVRNSEANDSVNSTLLERQREVGMKLFRNLSELEQLAA